MSPAANLREMLAEAASRVQPKPDWDGAARLARRMARLRLAAATGAAAVAAGALLAGGVAARAALGDEQHPSPTPAARPTPEGRHKPKPEPGGRTEGTPSGRGLPNLTVALRGVPAGHKPGGATLVVSNTGRAAAGPFIVSLQGNAPEPSTISFPGAEPGTQSPREIECTGKLVADVDPPPARVDESTDGDNTAATSCSRPSPPPPPPPPAPETAPSTSP